MNLFIESVILTKRYTRYGGDSESTLALVVDYKGVAYLFTDAETTALGECRLFSITSKPEYIKWLLDNSMDLLKMLEFDYPYTSDFYNDRNVAEGRWKELVLILKNDIGLNDLLVKSSLDNLD